MALKILEGYNLAELMPDGGDYWHLILEALKASFADRDRYFADPKIFPVPIDALTSDEYGARWRARITMDSTAPGMPEPCEAWSFSVYAPKGEIPPWSYPTAGSGAEKPDTSYLCVVDGEGNAFSATPSDGAVTGPLVPGLGFCVSARGSQSWADQGHPSAIGPGRRPRLTPSPGMVVIPDRLVMPYGSPGNDVQPQAMLQFLINVIDHGLDPQSAIEMPRCATYSFPRSTDPHQYTPGLVTLEGRVPGEVGEDLIRRGHSVATWPQWAEQAGSLGAIEFDIQSRLLIGAADPRRAAYVLGR
jgi:gamma-glutamyltranspeptidase/glutathione hydrolase